MYTLNQVIKKFKEISKDFPKDSLERNYYEIIIGFMLIENEHKDIVELNNKPIYVYFKNNLPVKGKEYFEFLYNRYNPVRFSIETFDSIEEIKGEIKTFFQNR